MHEDVCGPSWTYMHLGTSLFPAGFAVSSCGGSIWSLSKFNSQPCSYGIIILYNLPVVFLSHWNINPA